MGVTNPDIQKKIKSGIDFDKPVEIVKAKPGDKLAQYQSPGGDVGRWAGKGDPPPHPDSMGISSVGTCKDGMARTKVCTDYTPKEEFNMIKSSSKPIEDTWSLRGTPVKTNGGGAQYYLSDPSKLAVM